MKATDDGLGTISEKKNRVYIRAFPHEEALALRQAGLSYTAIAERYGVSANAVERVCDPAVRERMDQHSKQWIRENRRVDCLGGCGRLVWTHMKGRTGYCPTCTGARRSAKNVRDTELRCTQCGEWKPDDQYQYVRDGSQTRRYRRSSCRQCETAARAANRARNRERERAYDNARKRKGKKMSKFVVLRKTPEGLWGEIDRVDAGSRLHAIEKIADSEGVYAAVTEGHLTELTVQRTMAFKVSQNGSGDA